MPSLEAFLRDHAPPPSPPPGGAAPEARTITLRCTRSFCRHTWSAPERLLHSDIRAVACPGCKCVLQPAEVEVVE